MRAKTAERGLEKDDLALQDLDQIGLRRDSTMVR